MSDGKRAARLAEEIGRLPLSGPVQLMEVCGTHTMAIARSGIKAMLPPQVRLLSGPGCPVCVTPPEEIDAVLELAMQPDVLIATYGDMIRVPGSTPGDNLSRRRALGANVRVVYSSVDAVETARQNPDKEVIFLGVGFETTAPGTAAAVLTAEEAGIRNFSLFSLFRFFAVFALLLFFAFSALSFSRHAPGVPVHREKWCNSKTPCCIYRSSLSFFP